MDPNKALNMTMLCDFYELTMGNGYLEHGMQDRITYFDVFFRSVPDDGGYAIAAGLEQIIDYIENLHFTDEDIAYLRSRKLFSEAFLDYLKNFRFTGDIWAVPEGTPVFPREPLITVRAPAIQAQLVETYLLLQINHQSLIATKASRICRAAQGRTVLEFGSRRAQGADGAILGARAAYIGGCAGTACTISDEVYGVYAGGTMAHSWVQMFDSELDAFRAYCQTYPDNATLLVDTYNSLQSGVPNAIRAFNEVLRPKGITHCGIRFDSGDIAYLTKKARKMLDDAGWPDCKITVSNALDERLIAGLLRQGAQIDSFGVGERLITARSEPVFGGVYKLAAIEDKNGNIIPKIKISENVGKITNPTLKRSTAFTARTPAWPRRTTSACTTRSWTTRSRSRSAIPTRRGRKKCSPTSRRASCSCPSSATAGSCIRSPRSMTSAPTARSSLPRSGRRCCASTTRTTTMLTCRKSC